MKPSMLILLIFLIVQSALAQEQTIFSEEIEHGGYGGPVIKFTSVNDKFGVLVGGHGGWIINHKLVIGGGAYGLVNDIDPYVPRPLYENFLEFGYGGFEVEWVMNSDKLVHFSVHALIGGGGVQYRNDAEDVTFSDRENDEFFVLEPGATLDLNMTTWFRFSVGASYRFVNGVDSNSDLTSNKDLTGPAAMVMLRFGKF